MFIKELANSHCIERILASEHFTYSKTALDFQLPSILMSGRDMPIVFKYEAPDRRREWSPASWGSRPMFTTNDWINFNTSLYNNGTYPVAEGSQIIPPTEVQ